MLKRCLLWVVRGALLLVLLAVATPFLLPLDPYLPALERQLSRLSGRYLTIDHLSLEMLPTPRLRAEGISVWSRQADNGELFIRQMDIHPDLGQLLFARRLSIRSLDLLGVAANKTFLRSLAVPDRGSQGRPQAPTVEIITARALTIRLDKQRVLGPYRLSLLPDPAVGIQRLEVAREDGALSLELSAEKGGFGVRIRGRDWTLPVDPALHVSRIAAHGHLDRDGLKLARMTLHAYGGQVTGPVEIDWRKGWRAQARLHADALRMAPIIERFGGSGFQGDFHGDLQVSLEAPRFSQLFHAPRIRGPFHIDNGIIAPLASHRPPLRFRTFRARGELSRGRLETWESRLQAYAGTIGGHCRLSWRPQWRFEAQLTAAQLDSEDLLAAFLDDRVVAGAFSGRAKVDLRGERFAALFTQPDLQGMIELRDGVFYRADLEKASTRLNGNSGGQTRFRKLSAEVSMHAGHIGVTDLEILSQALRAQGGFQISPDERLRGHIDVGLSHTGPLASIPLTVGGTLADPSLRPSGAALVGGMVGSGLLGPGIGTAVGIKVGDTMDKLNRFLHRLGRGGEEE